VPRDAEFLQGDVANPADLARALEEVEVVFHLAAYQDYLPDFSTFIHTNTESAALLFELILAKRLPVRKIVFASSQSVAGEGRYRCAGHGVLVPGPRPLEQLRRGDWELYCPHCGCLMEPLLIDEATTNPHTAYGISKYAIELLAQQLGRRYEIPTVCMRYTYVQGPRNSFYNAYSGIARIFSMRIMQGLPPVCFEDGCQQRDYVNVMDAARANLLVMEDPRADGRVFHVGGGRVVTVLEFARIILRAFGSSLEPSVPGEFRVGDTRHTVSDISALRALGWTPTVPVEQSMRDYVAWIREQPWVGGSVQEAERLMRAQGVLQRQTPGAVAVST
jgi:dTDP-L-rhamnose 4-epimerase